MNTIILNPREFWSLCIVGAILCFMAGVFLACITIAVFVLPMRDADSALRVQSAYAKGTMVSISKAKVRCSEWELRNEKAVCR
jgi:hypothetical protein